MSRLIDENTIIKMLNTMDRYTSEELTLCDTDETFPKNEVFIVDDVFEGLDELPSAQPEPLKIDLSGYSKEDWERFRKEWANIPMTVLPEQRTGKWISADAIFGGVPFYCSECGENTRDTVMGKPRWNFCPNCGADMREVTNGN